MAKPELFPVQHRIELESRRSILRKQEIELTDQLRSVRNALEYVENALAAAELHRGSRA